MESKRTVCLLSSGLDSTVALALERENSEIALALTFDYGQRAARREIERAQRIATHYGVPHRVVELPFFAAIGAASGGRGGALLDRSVELPRPDRATLHAGGAVPTKELLASADRVWVPNRNGIFLEVAAAFAEALGAAVVIAGFNREEAATFPDNSIEYLAAATAALAYSTRGRVRLESPTAALDKREIVVAGRAHAVPLELCWPCYEGGAVPCASCESCQRFLSAAERADPAFASGIEWRGDRR